MTDRGAIATARAVGERLADDIRHGDLADILRLPELELPDRRAISETGAILQRLPERDLAVLAEALRELPRRVGSMEAITVPHDAPIPDRLVEAVPFLERERRTSPLVLTIAVISVVGFVCLGLVLTARRLAVRTEATGPEAGAAGLPYSSEGLVPTGGTSSHAAASAAAVTPVRAEPWVTGTSRPGGESAG